MRIESGRPRLGADMSEENLPGEAGIVERAVSFTKGCYVGPGAGRPHVSPRPPEPPPARPAAAAPRQSPARRCSPASARSGKVTSAAVSPRLGPIALAMVRREVEPGDEVLVGPGGPAATVVELPFG